MLLTIGFGFLADKTVKKNKLFILVLAVLYIFSFYISVSYLNNLYIFSAFLAQNLVFAEGIKVYCSSRIIELSKEEKVKDKNITIMNISSNIGSLLPSILFLSIVDVVNNNQWRNFFSVGVFLSLFILIGVFFLKKSNFLFEKKEKEKNSSQKMNYKFRSHFILLFMSYFLIWADFLYLFPLPSWIFMKFGEHNFKIFSICYTFFIFLNIGGWILAQRISSKQNSNLSKFTENNIDRECYNNSNLIYSLRLKLKKQVIYYTVSIYVTITSFIIISNFAAFLILYGVLNITSAIMLLNYVSLLMTVSSNGKHKTFSFQCLKSSYIISNVIFVPFGTILSSIIPTELIFIIVGILSGIALIPLWFMK
jgi:hypothetical protein